MSEVVEPEITFPCYLPYCEDGGLVCVAAGEYERICICLFTNAALLRTFWQDKWLHEHGEIDVTRDVEVSEYLSKDELKADLEFAESDFAVEGILYIAIDPQPGQQVVYIALRNFINRLQWR